MEPDLRKMLKDMSDKEKIELASEILKRINENSRRVGFETDPFFHEGLTDEYLW